MPQNVTESDAWTTPLTAAADGDAVNGANFLTVMQGYANRLKSLGVRVPGVVVGHNSLWPPTPSEVNSDWGTPMGVSTVFGPALTQRGITGTPTAIVQLTNVPNKGTLKSVTATVKGTGHSGLPATLPHMKLWKIALTGAAVTTLIEDVVDPSASQAAYDVVHQISTATFTEVLDTAKAFFAEFRGEAGANAIANAFSVLAIALVIDP